MITIKRSILILLCITICIHAQETYEDENDDFGDYSEPGAPTENCVCVPFFKCADRDEEEDEEVPEDGDEEDKYIKPRKPIRGRQGSTGCGPYNRCCKNLRNETSQTPYEHKCGQRNSATMSGRVVNTITSGKTEIAEWPWQVALLRRQNGDFLFRCGGTLIDEYHVLTVAHCVTEFTDNLRNLNVRLGEWDTQTSSADFPHEDFAVTQIFIHPEYKPRKFYNDIAILKLEKPVEFKPHIDTACLPKSTDNFEGQKCIVTGWGQDAFVNGAYSPVMKKVVLPVVGHDDCEDQLRTTKLGPKFDLHHGFICAGGKQDEDACTGDGGGPLVCFEPDTYSYILTGLVSWGVECGKPGVPGVYVDVQRYVDWISSITGKPLVDYWSQISI